MHGAVPPHSVVFCYCPLYHLSHRPLDALQEMAASCNDLMVLETRVSYAPDERLEAETEDGENPTNAVSGRASLPSRRWVYARLAELFAHVYMPLTQPAHPQFCLNWRSREPPPPGRYRAVFVASRRELVNSVLHRGVPDLQFADLPQLGARADPTDMTVVAARTLFGPFARFPDDLINRQLMTFFGAHTRNELALLHAFVDAGDVVYDIGAHIGTFAVPLAAAVGVSGRLVAVEANIDNYVSDCCATWPPVGSFLRAAQPAPSMRSLQARGNTRRRRRPATPGAPGRVGPRDRGGPARARPRSVERRPGRRAGGYDQDRRRGNFGARRFGAWAGGPAGAGADALSGDSA